MSSESRPAPPLKVHYSALKEVVRRIFEKAGSKPPEDERIAHYLVEANLAGHDSHGVIRVASYVEFLRKGLVLPNRSLQVVLETEALLVLDGQIGLGQTIGEAAMRLGIAKARQHGVAVLALRNCGHLGRIGDWPLQAARAGMISLHFVNTSGYGLLVTPFGGIDRRLSANPISVGVPVEGGQPIVLDISTCAIAEGKIKVAFNKGDRVPTGSIVDSEGRPTDDPRVFYADPPGSILPFGGHKGFGLSVITELLAGALTGSGTSSPGASRLFNGMLAIILDPGRFVGAPEFAAEVRRFVDFVKSSRTVLPGGEILMPGELEERTRKLRLRDGIEIDPTTWQQILGTCKALGIGEEEIAQIVPA